MGRGFPRFAPILRTLQGWLPALGCLLLVSLPARPMLAQPLVEIEVPAEGLVTHFEAVTVIVSFEARPQGGSQGRSNVSLVEVLLGGELVGSFDNPRRDKVGTFELVVGLADLPDGEAELTARAFQGNPNAGLFSEVHRTIRIDRTPPVVLVGAPAPDTVTRGDEVLVEGEISEPARVRIGNTEATVVGLSFFADVSLHEGSNLLAVAATDEAGNTGTAAVVVLRDTTPPRVTILSPRRDTVLSGLTATVTGTVQDLVIGNVDAGDCSVTVNGVEAEVAQNSFAAFGVPVAAGVGTLTAVARDRAGNTATAVIPVTADTRARARIVAVSGDGQQGTVGGALSQPLVARVEDNAGRPVAGVPVSFVVIRGDGTLDGGGRRVAVKSGIDGLAAVELTLGRHGGAASDQVEATTPGLFGTAAFCATALPDPTAPRVLAAVAGGNQRGEASSLAPEPLVVLLTEEHGNPVAGAAVTFEVLQGGGRVDGESTAMAWTDSDGRAFVLLTLGLDAGVNSQLVEAQAAGAEPMRFLASAVAAGDPADTAVSGVVLDNENQPISGAAVSLPAAGIDAFTDGSGRFRLIGAPAQRQALVVDGSTAGPLPSLAFEVDLVTGADNSLPRPVFLPRLDADGRGLANLETEVVITRADTPGLELVIPAGTATFGDGSKVGEVQVVRVHRDKIPMLPPDGTTPRLAFSIQPPDVVFDPPAPIRFPNTEGRAPGEIVRLYSFDHDVGGFVTVGTVQVSEDGAFVVSEAGQGLVKGGWHLVPPQPPPDRTCISGTCSVIRCNGSTGNCEVCVRSMGSCSCTPDSTISPIATPDANCYECPPPSNCPQGVCRGAVLGNPKDPDTYCERGYDPEFGLGGEPGKCRFPAGSDNPVCCPEDNWDAINLVCCKNPTVGGVCQ